jgi:hypothetical protein
VTEHDVLVGFRLRLFTLADELGNVSQACRVMGVDRSTYYRLKSKVDRWGLEALNVRERRRPRMPNQIGPHLEQRIIAFSLGHPGYGPRRISAELAREKWGGLRISEHGVWRVLVRFGLNTRSKRLALIARHRDPYERQPSIAPPARHINASEPARRCSLTASTSGGSPERRAPSGNTPPSTSLPRSVGPSCTPVSATRAHATRASCCTASRANSPPPAETARGHHGQRLGVPRQALPRRNRRAGRPPALHPRRAPELQWLRRTRPAHHPGRVLAPRLRPLTHPKDDRPRRRPRRLPDRLQH